MLEITIEDLAPATLEPLAEILHATVHAGASVSFILPFTLDDARRYWLNLNMSHRRLLLAKRQGDILGTVQLLLDTPPNQPHRAEVAKLLVHPTARREGIARQLMQALEIEAIKLHRTLLTLDTTTGSPAEQLYLKLGYQIAGRIPNYALYPLTKTPDSTTFFYKNILPPDVEMPSPHGSSLQKGHNP